MIKLIALILILSSPAQASFFSDLLLVKEQNEKAEKLKAEQLKQKQIAKQTTKAITCQQYGRNAIFFHHVKK